MSLLVQVRKPPSTKEGSGHRCGHGRIPRRRRRRHAMDRTHGAGDLGRQSVRGDRRHRHQPRSDHRRDHHRGGWHDRGYRRRRHGEPVDLQRHAAGAGVPAECRRHGHRPLPEQSRSRVRHSLARHRVGECQRRHAADAEHGAAGRHVPLQVHGAAAWPLLVSPASPLLDQPGVQGALRVDHRHRSRTRPRSRRAERCRRRVRR